MRLWHIDLIPYLPKSQLLAQWRELNSIFKKQDKHILINYIYNYPKEYLWWYTQIVINEMRNRCFNIKIWDNYNGYIDTNESIYIGNVIDRLAAFEDFMEEQGFESLEDLRKYIEKSFNAIELLVKKGKENQALKDRWQKLKEYITNEFNYDKQNIRMVGKDYGYGCINTEEDILSKMQELEKEKQNE